MTPPLLHPAAAKDKNDSTRVAALHGSSARDGLHAQLATGASDDGLHLHRHGRELGLGIDVGSTGVSSAWAQQA
jgi:hypothetical protein